MGIMDKINTIMKTKNTGMVELPLDVLDEIIEYIKETEEIIDEDLRPIRDLKALVRNLKMPRLYDRLIEIRDGATITKKQ